jgi:hypothetical protein
MEGNKIDRPRPTRLDLPNNHILGIGKALMGFAMLDSQNVLSSPFLKLVFEVLSNPL